MYGKKLIKNLKTFLIHKKTRKRLVFTVCLYTIVNYIIIIMYN